MFSKEYPLEKHTELFERNWELSLDNMTGVWVRTQWNETALNCYLLDLDNGDMGLHYLILSACYICNMCYNKNGMHENIQPWEVVEREDTQFDDSIYRGIWYSQGTLEWFLIGSDTLGWMTVSWLRDSGTKDSKALLQKEQSRCERWREPAWLEGLGMAGGAG